jgi:phosphohistidine phosphatase
MKTLLLLRHAKSSWNDESLDDYERPLSERGKRDAPRVGQLLNERQLWPDVVISSSARRARKTAQKAIRASGRDIEMRLADELYLANPAAYIQQLKQLQDQPACVMLVGHNPGMEELLLGLTGHHEHFPTAALANIQLPIDRWSDVALSQDARLEWLWKPRDEE